MTSEFDGLYIHNGTANVHLLSTGTEINGNTVSGLTVLAASDHGCSSIVPSTTTGRFTLLPGVYEITVNCSLENDVVSGLSSEDVTVQDDVTFYLAKGQAAGQNPTEITGTRTRLALFEGLPASFSINFIWEVTKAMQDSSINYFSLFGATSIVGGAASDVIIRQLRINVRRLD